MLSENATEKSHIVTRDKLILGACKMTGSGKMLMAALGLLAVGLFFAFGEEQAVETLIDYILMVLNFFESETPHGA